MKPNPESYLQATEETTRTHTLDQVIERGYTDKEEYNQLMLDASLLKQEGYFIDFAYIGKCNNGTYWKRQTAEPSPVCFVSFGGVITRATHRLELDNHPQKYGYLFNGVNSSEVLDVLSNIHFMKRTNLKLSKAPDPLDNYLWNHGKLVGALTIIDLRGI